MIAALTADAVEIECRFEYHTIIPLGSTYTCMAAAVTLTGSTTLETVTGDHNNEVYTNDNVACFWVAAQNLPFIPKGIGNFFKNLRALLFQKTNMLSISSKDFQPFPQIEYLNMHSNNLTTLDGDLFSYTPLLRYLHVGWNQIQHIGHNLVTNLEGLQHLYLFGNPCIDRQAANRSEVLRLASEMSLLCPPLVVTTTTKRPIEQCPCQDEIEAVRRENQQQTEIIEKLQQSNDQMIQEKDKMFVLNAGIQKRLMEVEMKLREISSTPCVY